MDGVKEVGLGFEVVVVGGVVEGSVDEGFVSFEAIQVGEVSAVVVDEEVWLVFFEVVGFGVAVKEASCDDFGDGHSEVLEVFEAGLCEFGVEGGEADEGPACVVEFFSGFNGARHCGHGTPVVVVEAVGAEDVELFAWEVWDVPDLDGVVGGGVGEGWGCAECACPGLGVVGVVVDEDAVAVDEGDFWFFGVF